MPLEQSIRNTRSRTQIYSWKQREVKFKSKEYDLELEAENKKYF